MALLIAEYESLAAGAATASGPAANLIAIGLMAIVAIAGLLHNPKTHQRPRERAHPTPRSGTLLITAVAAIIAFVIALRASLTTSTIAAGLVPIVSMVFIAIVLMPVVNDLVSTRPLVVALQQQQVPPEQIALYAAPYSGRAISRAVRARHLRHALHAGAVDTDRDRGRERARTTRSRRSYRIPLVDTVRMIGKWFYVYRR